ncbi:CHAT domain-containing tetratricopeptide repeat protein [Catalinimonas sp. 4WD22]|uniref:CHAT domain-containing protein n=1 Tax=Catalinimonas locisalis TaxID=3133978 RepID=UPI0031016F29
MIRHLQYVILPFALSFASPCIAQINVQADTTMARQHYEKAATFATDQEYDSALLYFEIAEKIYKKGIYYEQYIDCMTRRGEVFNNLGQYDKAKQLLEQALSLSVQQLGAKHLQTANAYDQLGWNQFYTSQYDEALQNYSTALDIFTDLQGDHEAEIARMNINIWNVYRRKYMPEKSIAYTLKGVDMLTALGQDTSRFAAAAYNGLGATYASMEVFDKALEYHHKALPLFLSAFGENHSNVAGSYFNIGNIYADRGDNATALEYYFKALRIDIHLFGENHAYVAGDYESIGICYIQKGDAEMARTYFQKSLDIAIASFGENDLHSAALISHIGATYNNQQNYEQALAYFRKSLNILEKAGENHSPQIAALYNNIGNTSLKLGQGEQALQYQQEALKVYLELAEVWQSRLGETYGYIGSCYEEMQDYNRALEYYHKDLEVRKQTVGLSHPEVAYVYANIGNVHRKLQHFSASLTAYQQALQVLYAPLDTLDIYQNPPIDQTLNPYILYEVLNAKALAFREYGEKGSGTVEDLNYALQTYQLAANTLQETRKSLMTSTSKNLLAGKSVDYFEDALETAWLLYERNAKNEYINQAFTLAEKSKAVALLEAMKESEAEEFANIPTSVLSAERALKIDLAFYKRKLFEEQQKHPDSSDFKSYQNKIFVLKNSYDSLIHVMEQKSPEYYQLKYSTSLSSVDQIQQQLKKSASLLSYFVGDSSIYSFVINKNNIAFYHSSIDSMYHQHVEIVRSAIAHKTDNIHEFTHSAYTLYHTLIAPAEPLIQGKNLIVIPDGGLSYLPFGVFIKSLPEDNKSTYFNLPYIIKDHQIAYAYSATLWQESLKARKRNSEIKYLAFAPSFNQKKSSSLDTAGAAVLAIADEERGSLANLKGTTAEVNAIANHFNGQFYEGATANEQLFKEYASSYDIIHLATHAIIDDMYPMNSRLLFSIQEDNIQNEGFRNGDSRNGDSWNRDTLSRDSANKQSEDGNLYAWELYNMKLNAQMTVLSACNTGFGKLQRGEGVMSLGRAFAYAGCPSIIMSLWPAQDQATAEIMVNFYQALSDGMSKDEALQKAKTQYLTTTNELFAHPFYWAGFVVQGDPSPLTLQKYQFSYWWWGSGVTVLLLGLGLFYRYKK